MIELVYGWYILGTDPSRRVKVRVNPNSNEEARGIEFEVARMLRQSERPALVPFELQKIPQRGKRHPKKVRVPLYPSYVFVQLETRKINQEFYTLRQIDGVKGILSRSRTDFKPVVLTETDAEFIKSLSETGWRQSIKQLSPFQPGAKVKIIDGPFMGFPAKVSTVARKKIDVMLHLFGSMRVVSMEADQLAVA
jgi:transcription antitermination factor NusG